MKNFFQDTDGNYSAGRLGMIICIIIGALMFVVGMTLIVVIMISQPPYDLFYDYALKFGENELPDASVFNNLITSYYSNRLTFSTILSFFGIASVIIGMGIGGKTAQTSFEVKKAINSSNAPIEPIIENTTTTAGN